MKVVLDLADLVAKGQLTPEEARRLQGFAVQDTGALGVNILLAFGTVAVSLGVAAFIPTVLTAIVLGALLFAVGLALTLSGDVRWRVFAQICMVIGALALTGGLSAYSDGSLWMNLALTAGLAVAAVVARSGLLAALSVLGLALTVGSSMSGWRGGFDTPISLTIVILAALTWGLFLLSLRIQPAYERLALIAARTAIMMVNFAFLWGSLFGDGMFDIPGQAFSIVWAVALIVIGLWAIRANRRWVVNVAAVFGAIHFFVQWFVALGASPLSILGGGVLLIAFGFGLRALNARALAKSAPAVAAT